MNNDATNLLDGISPATFKALFNGKTSISNVAIFILSNLNDIYEFPTYFDGLSESTTKLLTVEFSKDIDNTKIFNVSVKISDLFLDILKRYFR